MDRGVQASGEGLVRGVPRPLRASTEKRIRALCRVRCQHSPCARRLARSLSNSRSRVDDISQSCAKGHPDASRGSASRAAAAAAAVGCRCGGISWESLRVMRGRNGTIPRAFRGRAGVLNKRTTSAK
eukprot:361181-Chlamydomonas_euryale.AAC.8